MRVAVVVTVCVRVVMGAGRAGVNRLRRSERRPVAMSPPIRMAMHALAVAVRA